GQPVELAVRPAGFESHVCAVGEAPFVQALAKCRFERREPFGRSTAENPDHRHQLLRAPRERPRCRAAEQRDELAPLHSITSSTCASKIGESDSPNDCAVLLLTVT